MALSSPGLVLSVPATFGFIKPQLDLIRRLGATDFSAEDPGIKTKPGTTVKYPLSVVSEALAFDEDTNNYLTGGDTSYGQLTASHFLQGYDMKGVDIDKGENAARIKQLFSMRAATGLSMAIQKTLRTALDGTTASTGVQIVANPDLADYDALAADVSWLDKTNAALVVNGAEAAKVRAALHAKNLSASKESVIGETGFRDFIVVPGMTARAVIVPVFSIGFMAGVPAILADYKEVGTETDEDSGLSIGVVVANDQATNRIVVNGDLWFGACTLSANAGATTAGIIKVGTAT